MLHFILTAIFVKEGKKSTYWVLIKGLKRRADQARILAGGNIKNIKMENEILCRRIKVSGKVQGVWFRDSTLKKAHELSISGFVKNQPDGSVYIEAEGTRNRMNEFINWCHEGPPAARVISVEVNDLERAGFEGFRIVR